MPFEAPLAEHFQVTWLSNDLAYPVDEPPECYSIELSAIDRACNLVSTRRPQDSYQHP